MVSVLRRVVAKFLMVVSRWVQLLRVMGCDVPALGELARCQLRSTLGHSCCWLDATSLVVYLGAWFEGKYRLGWPLAGFTMVPQCYL